MLDRNLYRAAGVAFILFIWFVITLLVDMPSRFETIITVFLLIGCLGAIFAFTMLANLKQNPEAYNWMDPDLRLTRLKRKKRSTENYYFYELEKRKKIVEEYRQLRDQGVITNKDAWARTNYKISGKTLKEYEDEFPREESGRE